MSRLRVCAVLRERPSRLPPGPSGGEMRLLDCGPLVVVAEAGPREQSVTADALITHDETIRSLAEQVEAVLPARFGWIVADEAALRLCLEPHQARLLEALALTDGREQMTLRVYGALAPVSETPTTPAGEKPGTRYLERKRTEAERRREVREIAPLRAALAPLVRAERVERHSPGGAGAASPAASVYHLVDRGRSAEYRAIVASLASEMAPLRTSVTGPWPPYAYAPEGLSS